MTKPDISGWLERPFSFAGIAAEARFTRSCGTATERETVSGTTAQRAGFSSVDEFLQKTGEEP
jgi:hypothetical protein